MRGGGGGERWAAAGSDGGTAGRVVGAYMIRRRRSVLEECWAVGGVLRKCDK